jgi:hypothetical protein
VYLDPILEKLKLVKERLEVFEKEIEEKKDEIKLALESLHKSHQPDLPPTGFRSQHVHPHDVEPQLHSPHQDSSNLGVIPQ